MGVELPKNWAKLGATQRYQVALTDGRMKRLLQELPPATDGNRAKIESELAKLPAFERERFDAVLRSELKQRAGNGGR